MNPLYWIIPLTGFISSFLTLCFLSMCKMAGDDVEPCEFCGMGKLPLSSGTHEHFIVGNTLWHHDETCGWEGEEIKRCFNCGRRLI